MKNWISTLSLTPVNVNDDRILLYGNTDEPKRSLLRQSSISKNNILMDELDTFYSALNLQNVQQCLWCSRSTGQSQDHRGHSRLWGPLQFICIRHALHLLGPNMSWENNFKGPQRPNLFLMQEIIYMLNHPAHFISSCLQFSRMQYTALLWFWFFHTNTCNIISIQTFSIYWITAGNNRKLITDLHRKCQCSVPKKINSYLFGCLNMDLRAQEFTDKHALCVGWTRLWSS